MNNTELQINILDWYEQDDYITKQYIIRLYGKTIDNKSINVKINGYQPCFYVEYIHKNINNLSENQILQCYQEQYNIIIQNIDKQYKNNIIKHEITKKINFYYFSGEKPTYFLKLTFNNIQAMKNCISKLNTITFNNIIKLYENNIPPMLRFIHDKNIKSSGWIQINNYEINNINIDDSTSDYNIICDWNDIQQQNIDKIMNFKICSFDIECYSDDDTFPNYKNLNDQIIQIGIVFNTFGNKDYDKYILTLKQCDKIQNTTIIECKNESQLLQKWMDLIQEQDPDIMTGYNIFGFDYEYIYERLQLFDIKCKISKFKDRICKINKKELSSSALGFNQIKIIDTIGRVQIDLFKVIQKDYKLNSYKLDNVAENFINGQIQDVIQQDNYLILQIDKTEMLNKKNYIRLEIDSKINKNKFIILDINYNKNTIKIQKNQYNDEIMKQSKNKKWCLVKDDLKAKEMFAKFRSGEKQEIKEIAEYCIQDCLLVTKLLAKLDIINNYTSMANVCYVPLSYLFQRGQGIKCFSLVSKFCKQYNYIIPYIKYDNENEIDDEDGYEGAIVLEPKPGFYKQAITVLDYNSLYPNSIICKNISHETLVIDDEQLKNKDYQYCNIKYTYNEKKYECKFAKNKNGQLGIIPMILNNLLQERKQVKKLMENEKDIFKKKLYDGQQLALKITANSLYGQLGAKTSPIFLKQLAASTTAVGRMMIKKAQKYVQKEFVNDIQNIMYNSKNLDDFNKSVLQQNTQIFNDLKKMFDQYYIKPDVIYGDTDSIFINYNIRNKQTNEKLESKMNLQLSINLGILSAIFINNIAPKPQKIEYEKTFWPFILQQKKNYSGNKYTFDIQKFEQTNMGNVLKRRDNSELVKIIVGGLVQILLNEMDLDKSIKYLKFQCRKLLNGKFDDEYFILSKTLNKDYKDRSRHGHVILADKMIERNSENKPAINDRIQFIYIEPENYSKNKKKIKTSEMVECPKYIKQNNLKINYEYYLTNQIKNPCINFLKDIMQNPEQIFDDLLIEYYDKKNGVQSIHKYIKISNK